MLSVPAAHLISWALLLRHVTSMRSQSFYSRPDIKAPVLDVTLHAPQLSAGHIVIAPTLHAPNSPESGPYIFDNTGNLVWTGVDDAVGAGQTDIQGLHVCRYQDEDHLCFWQGRQRKLHGSGVGVIMNKNYQVVKTVQDTASTPSGSDLHEFHLTADGSALVTVYQPRLHDGTWVLDSSFREIRLNDSSVLFEWNSLDHIAPSESYAPQGTYPLLGDGLRNDNSWDYFHINSVDKNDEGDYLISSRHIDCVYKISGSDGSIMWRLQGDHSTYFRLADFTFRRQHHVRLIEDNQTHTIVSLFNNDNDRYIAQGNQSAGMIIEIDHQAKVARKVAEFTAPTEGGLSSAGSGSMVSLPDGNTLVGWGINSAMTEYLADGTPIWHAQIGEGAWNYRAYKCKWVGQPLQRPAIWTYAESATSPINIHVSWNGATEVQVWQFYASDYEDGPYSLVASLAKEGFETVYAHSTFQSWTFVEAMDVHGESLRNSSVTMTVVTPVAGAEKECALLQCSVASDDGGSTSSGGHIWDKPEPLDNHPAGAVSMTGAWLNQSVWQYFEHVMAMVGALACVGMVIFVSGVHVHILSHRYRRIK